LGGDLIPFYFNPTHKDLDSKAKDVDSALFAKIGNAEQASGRW